MSLCFDNNNIYRDDDENIFSQKSLLNITFFKKG